MENKLQALGTYEGIEEVQLTIYGDLENPLFLAKDVAEWIDYAFKDKTKGTRNVNMMLNTVDEDEKLVARLFTSGQNREMWFLTEDGLYEVLMQSRKPIAKQFKKKVKEILKALRKGEVAITPKQSILDKAILQAIKSDSMEERIIGLQIALDETKKPLLETIGALEGIVDTVISDEGLVQISNLGKILANGRKLYFTNSEGKEKLFGRNNIFVYLRENEILTKKNLPYSYYSRYIEIKNKTTINSNGEERIDSVVFFNKDGLEWFFKRLKKEGIIKDADIKSIKKDIDEGNIELNAPRGFGR